MTREHRAFRCIYCGEEKPSAARSYEHIWPGKFGGGASPDWFKTNDCCGERNKRRQCNHVMGQFVDAELVRTPFGTKWRLGTELPFVDAQRPGALPLVFMGRQSEHPSDDEICESWLGPRGEAVYYLHRIDRDDFKTYAGGDPIRRKSKDAGRVYFGLTKPNVYWFMVALLSVEKRFPGAEIRLLTKVDDPRITQRLSPETPQSIVDVQYILPRWRQRGQALQQTLNIDCGNRFLCKLALGFGHALFGPAFAERPHESVLRDGLWRRSASNGSDVPKIKGKGLFEPGDPALTRFLTNGAAFSLLFSRSPERAWISTFMPDGMSASCMILPSSEMLPSNLFEAHTDYFVVLLYPALNRFVGPLPLQAYIEHRTRTQLVQALAEIEQRQKTIAQIEAEVARHDIADNEAA